MSDGRAAGSDSSERPIPGECHLDFQGLGRDGRRRAVAFLTDVDHEPSIGSPPCETRPDDPLRSSLMLGNFLSL